MVEKMKLELSEKQATIVQWSLEYFVDLMYDFATWTDSDEAENDAAVAREILKMIEESKTEKKSEKKNEPKVDPFDLSRLEF
jgi:hypothetical protein